MVKESHNVAVARRLAVSVAFVFSDCQTVRYVQEVAESVVLKEDSGRRR